MKWTPDDLFWNSDSEGAVKARGRIVELCQALGIELEDRCSYLSNGWNGKSVALDCMAPGARLISSVVHDVAHWLVAPRQRRKVPDFGLGKGPDSGFDAGAPRVVSLPKAREEECLASCLGILIERDLGLDWIGRLWDHEWLANDWGCLFDPKSDWSRQLRRLHSMKLLEDGQLAGPLAMLPKRAGLEAVA